MAKEYKLPYTAFEISDKLRTVDEVKTALENDYYTKSEVNTSFEAVNESIGEVTASLRNKADLVDGKVSLEQLPDNIGTGGGLTEVAWEDIKNKPFYDDNLSIKIPSDISNCTTITSQPLETMGGMGFSFVKVSDDCFTAPDETYGALIKLQNDGTILEFTVKNNNIVNLGNGFGVLIMENGFYPLIMNITSVGVSTFPTADSFGEDMIFNVSETGVYFLHIEGMAYVESFEINKGKTLDPKYLPAGSIGYETRPFEDIIWDGNTDGLPMVSADVNVDGTPMTLTVYKVSDSVIPMDAMYGAEITYAYNNGEEEGEDGSSIDNDSLFSVHSNGSYASDSADFFCITEDNTSANLSELVPDLMMDFLEAGIWFLVLESGGMEMQRTISLNAPINITKIDVKYLPTDEPYGVVTLDFAGKIPPDKVRASSTVSQYDSSPVSSQAVYTALGGRSQLTIESTVNSYSSNPVSSSAVYTAIENKQINVDPSVQSGSNNAVSGNAVYNKLQNYYTKSEIANDYYTKSQVDTALNNINLSNYYTKSQVYTKSEIDNLLGDVDTILNEINTLIGE